MATALKTARVAAGWSQTQVIARMREAAAALGEQLPKASTLRVELFRWENGRRRPGAFYRRVFCTVYQCPPEHLDFGPEAGTGGVPWAAVAALLYAAPLGTEQLRTVPPARVRLYAVTALADPRTPTAEHLAAGLHRTRVEGPAWLDRERLRVCEQAAQRADAERDTPPEDTAGRVPDWVATTGRLVSSGIAAAVFTNHPN